MAAAAVLALAPGAALPQSVRPGNLLDTLPAPPARAPQDTAPTLAAPDRGAAVPATLVVVPQRFDIEGVTALPFAEVAQLFTPLAGQPTTAAALVQRAQEASALYTRAGYALSFFFIPAQDFAQGVVRVVAVEGHVAALRIEGNAGRAEPQLRALAAPILAERPLTRATFERYTGLLGQLPGLSVQAQVPAPASTDGATTLSLLLRPRPVAVSLGAAAGQPRSRAVVTGELNGVLLPGGQLSASTLLLPPGDERYYAAAYTQAVGSEGLVLKLSASFYRADPVAAAGLPAGPLEREATQRRTELSASYPLQLSASRSLTLSGGLYGTDTRDAFRNPVNDAQLTDETRARVVFLQLAYVLAEPDRQRTASVLLAQGIDGLGARAGLRSNLPGLDGPNGVALQFTRLLLQGGESVRLANGIGLSASGLVQWGSGVLPSSERISFGGVRFGRGYAPGQAGGDSGWGVALEVNRRLPLPLPTPRPLTLEPYLLLEAARTRGRAAGSVSANLLSATVGARLSDPPRYTLDVGIGQAMGDAPLDDASRKPRVQLLLGWRLDER